MSVVVSLADGEDKKPNNTSGDGAPVVVVTPSIQLLLRKNKTKTMENRPKKKGRPELHPFPGRITLVKKEVEDALRDGTQFILDMQSAHAFDDVRRAELIAAKKLTPGFQMMFYTFQGPIEMVLAEVNSTIARWENHERLVDIEVDFHKKKPVTDESKPYYRAPIEEREPLKGGGTALITKQIEAYPDRLYGYLTVTLRD